MPCNLLFFTWLVLNSLRSTCLCLPVLGLKAWAPLPGQIFTIRLTEIGGPTLSKRSTPLEAQRSFIRDSDSFRLVWFPHFRHKKDQGKSFCLCLFYFPSCWPVRLFLPLPLFQSFARIRKRILTLQYRPKISDSRNLLDLHHHIWYCWGIHPHGQSSSYVFILSSVKTVIVKLPRPYQLRLPKILFHIYSFYWFCSYRID